MIKFDDFAWLSLVSTNLQKKRNSKQLSTDELRSCDLNHTMEIKCVFYIAVNLCEIVQHCNVYDTLQCVARNITSCRHVFFIQCLILATKAWF